MIVGWRIDTNSNCGVRMIRRRLRLVMPLMSRTASLTVSGTGRVAGFWIVRSVIDCTCSGRGSVVARAGRVTGERQKDVVERRSPDTQGDRKKIAQVKRQ